MARHPLTASEARAFLVAAIVIPLAIWPIAFNFGAFGTLFFRDFYKIWILIIAAFMAHVFLAPRLGDTPETQLSLGWSFVALISSTLVVISWINIFDELPNWLISVAEVLVLVYTVPYVTVVLIYVSNPEIFRLRRWDYLLGLVFIIVITCTISFLLGLFHPYFLVCEEFVIAGEYVPQNCTPAAELGLDFGIPAK